MNPTTAVMPCVAAAIAWIARSLASRNAVSSTRSPMQYPGSASSGVTTRSAPAAVAAAMVSRIFAVFPSMSALMGLIWARATRIRNRRYHAARTMPTPTNVTYFRTPAEMRKWLRANHKKAAELWVGYYKKDTGKPSVTWPESVDEALCVGWIDGIRKRLGPESYTIRFSPRRNGSIWSAVNIARVKVLTGEKRMQP